jgi:hypothetical protein
MIRTHTIIPCSTYVCMYTRANVFETLQFVYPANRSHLIGCRVVMNECVEAVCSHNTSPRVWLLVGVTCFVASTTTANCLYIDPSGTPNHAVSQPT